MMLARQGSMEGDFGSVGVGFAGDEEGRKLNGHGVPM
jgi:hypothetical protein